MVLGSALLAASPSPADAVPETPGSFQIAGNTAAGRHGAYLTTAAGTQVAIDTRAYSASEHNVTIYVSSPAAGAWTVWLRGPNGGGDLTVGTYQNDGYFPSAPVNPGLGILGPDGGDSLSRLPSWFTVNRIDIAADHTVQAIDVTFVNYSAGGLADYGRLVVNYDPVPAQVRAVGAVSLDVTGRAAGSGLWRTAIGNSVFAFVSPDGVYAGGTDGLDGGGVKFTPATGKTLGVGTYKSGDGSAFAWSGRTSACNTVQTYEFTVSRLTFAADGSIDVLDAFYAGQCDTSTAQGRVLIGVSAAPAMATATVRYTSAQLGRGKNGMSIVRLGGTVTCGATTTVHITGGTEVQLSSSRSASGSFQTITVPDCRPDVATAWTATVTIAGSVVATSEASTWASYALVDPFYRYTVGNEAEFSLIKLTAEPRLQRR
ncbi:hypothetical protein HDA40_004419 [Hamadaea flava]|uniref:Uncharacterized protein n=1 Tax=Hamadaea flava TaxID=1742688 RepID=A0ABV8LGK0_9ACTN|nr:hypothetical protein [Hamadaea flava]MCP2325912.1 hypothetical protein [Hamadaea flava]